MQPSSASIQPWKRNNRFGGIKAQPVLSVDELFAELAIKVTEKAAFVFGDNVDGYYDGCTHTSLQSGRYQHQKQHDFSGFQVGVNGEIQDKNQALSADILPYGVVHYYAPEHELETKTTLQDSFMLLSGRRSIALSVTKCQSRKFKCITCV